MRKLALAVTIGAACLGIAACSQSAESTTETTTAQATEAVTESENTETEAETGTETAEKESETEAEETESGNAEAEASESTGAEQAGLDNFSVDMETVAAMGKDIKAAVEAKDLDALAELTSYPVYVGLEGVKGVETKEDFLALGADAIFTDELVQSVTGADETALEASKAGFTLSSGDSSANVIFGIVDGELKVTGINY
ncbi:MAG: hypothetical protein ACOX8K_03785 [Lachnospiraceae bacterium]|jgi:predicted lipid-binding transport protein (Tim44 family)